MSPKGLDSVDDRQGDRKAGEDQSDTGTCGCDQPPDGFGLAGSEFGESGFHFRFEFLNVVPVACGVCFYGCEPVAVVV